MKVKERLKDTQEKRVLNIIMGKGNNWISSFIGTL